MEAIARGGMLMKPFLSQVANSVTGESMQPANAIPEPSRGRASDDWPLFVDMDGTLVATDLLWESAMLFASRQPFQAWRIPLWLLGGKANLKRQLAMRAIPDASTLPYREPVLQLIREARTRGRMVILATASDARIAAAVALHLDDFDHVIGSDGKTNCSKSNKLQAIQEWCDFKPFGYVGNSLDDVPIWAKAQESYLVACSANVLKKARRVCTPNEVLQAAQSQWKEVIKSIRPHQWVKNLLIVVPLFAAHLVGKWPLLVDVITAVAAFSMCASSVYLVNDLLDIEADRRHPRKRRRPFASGTMSIPLGIGLAGGLVLAGFAISAILLPAKFSLLLLIYMAAATAYSFYFKRRLLQDVFLLAALYTLRILAGGAAIGVEISPWLLAFSLFFFLSLAFVKRYSELLMVVDREGQQAAGRGYLIQDMEVIASVGPASGFLAVLVMCLYLNSEAVSSLYRRPSYLWAVTPILLYWITRIWFLARRQTLSDDPVVFAVRDRVSLISGAIVAAIFLLAI